MRLPNGRHARVDDRKLLDYVLNPNHPVGRHHARLFRDLLGIGRENHSVLKDALLQAARESEATAGRESPYGRKYETRFWMTGPRGQRHVLAVWLIEVGSDVPRLITCFVE